MYIVRWLGHNGNRLYGSKGLQSKMLEWVSGVEWSGWMDGWMDTPKALMFIKMTNLLCKQQSTRK